VGEPWRLLGEFIKLWHGKTSEDSRTGQKHHRIKKEKSVNQPNLVKRRLVESEGSSLEVKRRREVGRVPENL